MRDPLESVPSSQTTVGLAACLGSPGGGLRILSRKERVRWSGGDSVSGFLFSSFLPHANR
jgi:hypothetical protein